MQKAAAEDQKDQQEASTVPPWKAWKMGLTSSSSDQWQQSQGKEKWRRTGGHPIAAPAKPPLWTQEQWDAA